MIVVTIIGLLAAIAVPTFFKLAQVTHRNIMISDAKQIGSAAEQYFTEESTATVSITIDSETGSVGLPLGEWVPKVTKGYTITSPIILDGEFTLTHFKVRGGQDGQGATGGPVRFTSFGQLVPP